MTLTDKQNTVFKYLQDNTTTEILFGGGAGGAKSFTGCLWLLSSATMYPGTRWLMGRSKLKALKETTLVTFFDVAKMAGVPFDQFHYNSQDGTILFKNGSIIILKDLFLYPSDPKFDSLGSLEISGAFIDEANQVSVMARNIVKSRIRYKLEEFGISPKLLMTCNPAKNWVYADFYKPSVNKTIKPYRVFIQALLTDNEFISSHYESNLQTLDEVSKQRLLFGNWEYDSDPSKLINFDNIVNLWTNTHVPETGQQYSTIDVARLGKDKSVIFIWKGLVVVHIEVIPKSKLDILGKRITELKNEYKIGNSHVLADEDGVGGGIVDFLHIKGFVNNSRPLNKENFANLKSQCYYKLAKVINQNGIYIKSDKYRDEIIEELEQIKSYKIDSDTKLRVLPKDKIKEALGRSPDFADVLMMRMFYEVGNHGSYNIH
jgi:hypothetical protein